MKLLELTEPLFQCICRLNRMARMAASIDYDTARAEIVELLARMAERSTQDHRLAEQYERVEPALVYFVDSIIAESKLPFAAEWHAHRLAFERGELAGDEVFFILLEETLEEKGDEAAERLAVYYTCLGLGFRGWLAGQPEKLRRTMASVAVRIRSQIESSSSSRLCPAAYAHTNHANLPLPVAPRLIGLAIVAVGLLLVVGIANIRMYNTAAGVLALVLDYIVQHDQAETR
jgi:type IV/VI secretion system ImpK/VasF family protein